MKKVLPLATAVVIALAFSACQAVFTYSPFKAFQRSPASMSPTEQLAYAQQALASGNPAAMKAAYDVLKNTTDPQTQVVAAQLAFGASGASQVFNQALGALASGSLTGSNLTTLSDAVQTAVNSVDTSLASAGAAQIASAAAGGATVTDSQYAMAAASLAASAVKQSGGSLTDFINNPPAPGTPAGDTLAQAKSLKANITDPALLQSLSSLGI